MIIPALVEYYARLESDPKAAVPPFGWSRQRIGFVAVLNEDGTLHAIEPPPGSEESAKKRFSLIVPGQSKPSGSGLNPCFLWDNATYLLGHLTEKQREERKTPSWAWKRFEAFRNRHLELEGQVGDSAFNTVCLFLRSWNLRSLEQNAASLEAVAGFGVIRIRTAKEYVHQREEVTHYWAALQKDPDRETVAGPSLTSGKVEHLARLHEPKIKGVRGGQTSGTLLVSFNKDAFTSYGKSQGLNAPLSISDAFRYCSALNNLLADARRKAQIGDTATVFWSAKPHPVEDITGYMVSGIEDTSTLRRVESYLDSLRRGIPSELDHKPETPFYILGLAPNASRLSVRFWHTGTVGTFTKRLAAHANALEVQGAPDGYSFPSIQRLVRETAPLKGGWPDEDKIPPVLAGELTRSILTGAPYPRSLLSGVIRRIRTEGFINQSKRKDWRTAMHRRASIIKACLSRGSTQTRHEVPMTLNREHPETAYQLGRLFAVLEKTQEEAFDNKLNSTIRSKFIGAASATPATVFPRILRLHMHHLAKIEHPGRRINLERSVGEICSRIDSSAFPSHLPIEAQGLFFLGYYQQRQDLYTSKTTAEASTATA